jgi:hypothetical protein
MDAQPQTLLSGAGSAAATPVVAAAAPATPGGGRPFTRTSLVASIVFVAMAALDTFHPATLVTGSWWLVLLLVWQMPWPAGPFNPVRPLRPDGDALHQLTALVVLAWLYYRANSALMETATYWEFALEGKLRSLNFVAQNALIGLSTAALFARPLHRCFTRRTVAAASLIAVPWFILGCADTAFDFVRWTERPLSNALWLFEASFPPLLLMQACALLERRRLCLTAPGATQSRSTIAKLGAFFDRCPRWFASSAIQPIGMIMLFAIGVRLCLDPANDYGPFVASAVALIVPLIALVLTVAIVHHLRTVRRARPRLGLRQRVAEGFQTALVLLLLIPMWVWVVFVDAPLAEYFAKDALAAIPGPDWSINYDADRTTLVLAGEYQFGVATAFAEALDQYPDAHTVELEGPGGLETEGFALAHAIQHRDLVTHAIGDCESACTLAFLAGRERILGEDASLGFHAVSAPVFTIDLNANYDRYLAGRGVEDQFIRRAAATPADDMWYPTNDELEAAGVITAVR